MAAHRPRLLRRPLRVYVDTSVFGGVHDDEFREPSERFFAAVRDGAFVLLVSEALALEIAAAPDFVQATFEALASTPRGSRPRPRRRISPRPTSPPASSPPPRASMPSTWPWLPWPAPTPS